MANEILGHAVGPWKLKIQTNRSQVSHHGFWLIPGCYVRDNFRPSPNFPNICCYDGTSILPLPLCARGMPKGRFQMNYHEYWLASGCCVVDNFRLYPNFSGFVSYGGTSIIPLALFARGM